MTKSFGTFQALAGLDLEVLPGEIHGFLGPNGAGKSTTIRGILGQLRLDSGAAQVFGLDAWRDSLAAHRRLAYVPGDVALWPGLTGGECIDLLGSLQGSPVPARRVDLLERFDLDPTRRVRTYSKGNRQKVALVAALSAAADLLLLDEPTSGLDPLMEAQFQAVLRERADEGAAVLLSSHIMSEVEALCDRVSIIRSGQIVREGTLDSLRADTASTIAFVTTTPLSTVSEPPEFVVVAERPTPGGVHTTARVRAEAVPAVMTMILAHGATGITVTPPTLDELFLEHYRTRPPESEAVPR